MTPQEIVEQWYLALTLWGEARGQGPEAMQHVGWVVRNRRDDPKRRWPRTIWQVVTQHRKWKGREIYQFSCWSPDDPNRMKLAHPMGQSAPDRTAFLTALAMAATILGAPADQNPIPRVYWYTDRSIQPPDWTKGLVEVQGPPGFRWYREA